MMNLANPTLLVIVGITGDLSRRKLIPALYQLERENMLSGLRIIGTTRRQISVEELKAQVREIIIASSNHCDDEALDRLIKKLEIAQIDTGDEAAVSNLGEILERNEAEAGVCMQRLFYLAVPPSVFLDIATMISKQRLDKCSHGTVGKILIEKPFGQDLESAKHLAKVLNEHYDEQQIYRIDHYLAKETAQNIAHFRFQNPLVHDLWKSKFIDNIQITVAEEIGIEGRVDFYEQTGALRDIVQSHLLQLLTLVTMQKPEEFDADHMRRERRAILSCINQIHPEEDVVFGQYAGYKDEVSDESSSTETFVALKLTLDHDDWRNVPFYVRTGKALATKTTEISIIYKDPSIDNCPENVLTFKLQPNEGIALKLQAKKPGLKGETQDIVMDYCYERSGHEIVHDAYQKLLIDAMNSDQTLFPSSEGVIYSWEAIEPLVESTKPREVYDKGSWGPESAQELLKRDGRQWSGYDKMICIPRIDHAD